MDEEAEVDRLSQLIIQYLYEQKLKGRTEIYERELHDVMGYPFNQEGDGRLFRLTALGESKVVYLDEYRKKLH